MGRERISSGTNRKVVFCINNVVTYFWKILITNNFVIIWNILVKYEFVVKTAAKILPYHEIKRASQNTITWSSLFFPFSSPLTVTLSYRLMMKMCFLSSRPVILLLWKKKKAAAREKSFLRTVSINEYTFILRQKCLRKKNPVEKSESNEFHSFLLQNHCYTFDGSWIVHENPNVHKFSSCFSLVTTS